MAPSLTRTLIYDGDCGFCTTSAAWFRDRLRGDGQVIAWQALPDLADYGLTEADVTTAAYWIDDRGAIHRGHIGIGHALRSCRNPWPLAGRALLVPPISWIAGPAYKLIAKNRHRLPGSTDACRLPQ